MIRCTVHIMWCRYSCSIVIAVSMDFDPHLDGGLFLPDQPEKQQLVVSASTYLPKVR
jgi:hypothetical protein